jgi:hypothetical protein
MPPIRYTRDHWFMRTARTLPVVAMAAVVGGAVGGFSVYAIFLALTESPNAVALKAAATQTADSRPQNSAAPIRTIGTPPPNVTESPTLPTQPPQQAQAAPVPQTIASSPSVPQSAASSPPVPQAAASSASDPQTAVSVQTPAAQTPWPDALSRAHPTPPQTATAAPVTAPPAGSESVAVASSKPMPTKPAPPKRRVASRKPFSAPNQNAANQSNRETAARSQPVYDYYDNDNRYGDRYGDNRYGDAAPAPRGRIVVRRLSRDGYYQSDAPPPPQPAPPGLFGGFFGGGDRGGDWR